MIVGKHYAGFGGSPDSVRRDPRYTSYSRFTDPGDHAAMLEDLPETVEGICQVASQQTIHHNLLPSYGIPFSQSKAMRRVWPPKLVEILEALAADPPHNLREPRSPRHRVVGACMLESHLLAGLLRSRGFAVRIRPGYFRGIRRHRERVVAFWETVSREKGIRKALLRRDPSNWREVVSAETIRQNAIDHHIEHWICEYWDPRGTRWRLLDANNAFLKAHSGLDVGYRLPNRYFEFAHEAWRRMRTATDFNPDQYVEEPQDGRSHIRSQLLWDFFSLLNHDIAGYDEPSPRPLQFVKKREYGRASRRELGELDRLARLMARDPGIDALAAFYRTSPALRVVRLDRDPYSFASGT